MPVPAAALAPAVVDARRSAVASGSTSNAIPAVARPAPRAANAESPALERRREASRLMGEGRTCDAVDVLRLCAAIDRSCSEMLAFAQSQCRR